MGTSWDLGPECRTQLCRAQFGDFASVCKQDADRLWLAPFKSRLKAGGIEANRETADLAKKTSMTSSDFNIDRLSGV